MTTMIKQASKAADADSQNVTAQVQEMLQAIETGGRAKAEEFARRYDGWDGEIVVPQEAIESAGATLDQQTRDDIRFSHDRVRKFAEAQRGAIEDGSIELDEGVWAGFKSIPVQVVGCYVPGGRYPHVASAIMSVTTARVAGVETVIAASPPKAPDGIHPAILYALDICGADSMVAMGGVQAVAAMAFGLLGHPRADILVGPGNQFVAEAKRLLFGRVGIDMFAGPTEIAIIADDTADAELVAWDLVGQAEHGYNSPAWLVSLSEDVAQRVLELVPGMIASLPETNRINAEAAWRDHGEIVLAESREEAVHIADTYAAEHLEVHCRDLDWWLEHLHNYGSLFLGPETTVAFGDKASGPNHILPTRGAARYTGGLSVAKFMKTVTWQRMKPSPELAHVTARISRTEGMEGHARTADIRLQKWSA